MEKPKLIALGTTLVNPDNIVYVRDLPGSGTGEPGSSTKQIVFSGTDERLTVSSAEWKRAEGLFDIG